MRPRTKQTFNDGIVIIKRDASANGTYTNPTAESLTNVGAFCYEESTIRNEDLDFMEHSDITEQLKIKIPESGLVKSGMYAVLRGALYYIYRADPNRSQDAVYLYMKEARHGSI